MAERCQMCERPVSKDEQDYVLGLTEDRCIQIDSRGAYLMSNCSEHTEKRLRSQLAAALAKVAELEVRRRESRGLLLRLTKYVREDKAVTSGTTRLDRLVTRVIDYLERTRDPRDMLRLTPDSVAVEYLKKEGKDG